MKKGYFREKWPLPRPCYTVDCCRDSDGFADCQDRNPLMRGLSGGSCLVPNARREFSKKCCKNEIVAAPHVTDTWEVRGFGNGHRRKIGDLPSVFAPSPPFVGSSRAGDLGTNGHFSTKCCKFHKPQIAMPPNPLHQIPIPPPIAAALSACPSRVIRCCAVSSSCPVPNRFLTLWLCCALRLRNSKIIHLPSKARCAAD